MRLRNIGDYKNGVTLLLRESLEVPPQPRQSQVDSRAPSPVPQPAPPPGEEEKKICVTNPKGFVRERVGDVLFEYNANSFFQNNNSVLVPLTSYVRDALFAYEQKPTHLVDAYCGSGLFALTLEPHFEYVRGIELSAESIQAAQISAKLNGIPSTKVAFMEGDAANIFDNVTYFPRAVTALIIDPPRKGTDERFIDQLVSFGCTYVAYVSCNVHTQARDVGMILRKSAAQMNGKKYVLESVRGFDLFPQTAHVESVAVLKLVDA